MYPVSLRNVGKTYRLDTVTVPALSAVSIDIRPGRFTVLCGPSGSGKTTLLNMMGCIDRPDDGEIQVDGQAVQAMTDDALSDFRARRIGFVFQNFNLLPVLTAFENVEYPLVLAAVPAAQRKERVRALLDAVQAQQVDLAVTSLTINEQRARQMDFSQPWFEGGVRLLVSRQHRSSAVFRAVRRL